MKRVIFMKPWKGRWSSAPRTLSRCDQGSAEDDDGQVVDRGEGEPPLQVVLGERKEVGDDDREGDDDGEDDPEIQIVTAFSDRRRRG